MRLETVWAASLGAVSGLTRRMSDENRYRWAARVGRAMTLCFPDKVRAVEANLAVINARSGNRFSSRQVFESFALTLSDFLSQSPVTMRVEGREKAEEALKKGRGAVFLTSHLGNWELGGRVLAEWGWPVTAVYQPYRSEVMQRFIQKRRAAGLSYLAVGKGAAAGVARILQRRETVAFLADRPFGEDGCTTTLCGRPARLPRGPFLFACRYDAPVIPGFVLRESPGRYRTVIEDPIWPAGKGPHAIEDLIGQTAQVLENYICRYGDQWYCFEPVWDDPRAQGGRRMERADPADASPGRAR